MANDETGGSVLVRLTGRIDSANAAQTEQDVRARLAGAPAAPVVLDASALEYLSSAGLRMILGLKRTYPDLRIVGVRDEVYEVFEMTGFTSVLPIGRAGGTAPEELRLDAPGTDAADELEVEALLDALQEVQDFVDAHLEAADCPMKAQMQIRVAVEEIFVNIAHYAYAPGTGYARIRMEVGGTPPTATITITDSGVPYNPLEKSDPDTSLSADERQIGGLGIYMTKKLMDDVRYAHRDGQNILTLVKRL